MATMWTEMEVKTTLQILTVKEPTMMLRLKVRVVEDITMGKAQQAGMAARDP